MEVEGDEAERFGRRAFQLSGECKVELEQKGYRPRELEMVEEEESEAGRLEVEEMAAEEADALEVAELEAEGAVRGGGNL